MRLIRLALVSLLGCTHPGLSGEGYEPVAQCNLNETCYGGSGRADAYVAIAVGGVIVGAVALEVYRHLTQSQ